MLDVQFLGLAIIMREKSSWYLYKKSQGKGKKGVKKKKID